MPSEPNRPPLSERLCEVTCLVFALWTLVCNFAVWSGYSFNQLLRLSGIVTAVSTVLGISIYFILRRRRSGKSDAGAESDAPGESDSAIPSMDAHPANHLTLNVLRGVAIAIGVIGLIGYPLLSRIQVFWWGGVGALVLGGLALLVSQPPQPIEPARRSRAWEGGLWLVAIAAVLLNLFVHRPDADDALYLNITASAVVFPDMPLMDRDMMMGIEGLPFHSPVYLTNSIELLMAVISHFSGWSSQFCFHVIYAALGGAFVVLAYAVFLRMLVPDRWLLALVVLIMILMGAGGPFNHWYGNLAFLRIWQGKCTFLHALLPLTFAFGMRFAMRPTLYGWFLLCTAQITAVGLSSSAIWVEPLAAGIGLLCGAWGRGWRGLRDVIVGCIGSTYVLMVGLHLKGLMRSNTEKILREDFRLRDYNVVLGKQEVLSHIGQALDWAWKNVMGEGPLLYMGLGAMILSWTAARSALARRFAVIAPLLTLLFIMNPYIERFVMANVTGQVYYRSSWLLPIPILMTLIFLAPLYIDPTKVPRKQVVLFMLVAAAGYMTRATEYTTLHPKNHIYYGMPGPKISPSVLEPIRVLRERLEPGSYVVAPTLVNLWMPTFERPLYPVTVHKLYTVNRHPYLTLPEVFWRYKMTEFVAGEQRYDDSVELFRDGLDHYGIQAAVVQRSNPWRDEVEAILEENRFEPVPTESDHSLFQVWIRPPDDPGVVNAPTWKILVNAHEE